MDMRPSWMQGDSKESAVTGSDANSSVDIDKGGKTSRSNKKLFWGSVTVVLVIIVAGFGVIYSTNSTNQEPTDTLGANTSNTTISDRLNNLAGFPVYYFADGNVPSGLTYVEGSAQYEQDVLFYSLTDDNGNKIVVSQQKVPEDLAGTIPQGDEKIETNYGNGGISLLPDRTTVNIISDDNIFILINAPATVSIDTIKTIARSLSNS